MIAEICGIDSRRTHVAIEDVSVTGERRGAFLDARPAGVVQPDHRGAGLQREVHDLADLLAHDLAERSAEHREVLREDEHLATVDRAPSGHDGIAERPLVLDPEPVRPMADEHVGLDERVLVQEPLDALPGGELAPVVLLLDGLLATRQRRFFPERLQLAEPLLDHPWLGLLFLGGHRLLSVPDSL